MNIQQHLPRTPRLRMAIQTAFALFCLYAGWQFYHFLLWATGHAETAVLRPSSVEGFLPISALLAFKRLIVTGLWDTVHPAGLTILVAAMIMALLARKGFCGYICPVGLISRMLAAAGKRLNMEKEPPRWVHRGLTSIKYILFAFFAVTVLNMNVQSIEVFLRAPYNLTADAKMLYFFLHPTFITLGVFALLAVLGMLVPYFWCRYLCPYGAMLGLFSIFSPLAITRNPDTCLHCGQCSKVCPGGIKVETKLRVTSPECIGCMQCVEVCPAKGCLEPSLPFIGRIHRAVPGLLAVAILLLMYLWAISTGHWDTEMPAAMLRRFYAM